MIHHEGGSPPDGFNPDYLKSLSYGELSEALIGEAQLTATQLDGNDRARLENKLMGICWIPDDDEQAEIEDSKADISKAVGGLIQAVVAFTDGEILEPEDAADYLSQRAAGRALAKIDHLKKEIDDGIVKGVDDDYSPWVEGNTQHSLIRICEAQAEAGINYASDYVRETAVASITYPGMRGVVLLHNVAAGDEASYRPAIESMQEGFEAGVIAFDEASEGLKVVMNLIPGADEVRQPELKNLAIDLIARLRDWSGITPSYSTTCAELTAETAVLLRGL